MGLCMPRSLVAFFGRRSFSVLALACGDLCVSIDCGCVWMNRHLEIRVSAFAILVQSSRVTDVSTVAMASCKELQWAERKTVIARAPEDDLDNLEWD